MEKRKPAGLLALPSPHCTAPLGALPCREPCRVPASHSAADCPGSRLCRSLPPGGVGEPSFLCQRNERERQRVRCVNEGYAHLRQHLPRELAGQRLSKVETLRAAISYIKHLQELLKCHRPDCNSDGESKASSGASPCSEPEEHS
ncbi:achaete-scute homolog 4 [Psammomys obesus]|uniref:achaete-scute homolog 4 n=1 Tax=Psammomys obesus TaxID=48139 RepID=UPI0024531B04|nr:achaete-scute homolog 4 [Psammomys obesus]